MASDAGTTSSFDRLREHSIGLPQVLFQSITHMAPGAAIAFSILVSVGFAGPALPLSVLFALVACTLVAISIGQLAKQVPSAGGLYAYVSRALGPHAGFIVGWAFLLFEPLVAPLLFLIFAWATTDVVKNEWGWNYTGQWWIWIVLAAGVVFFLTYRDVRLSTEAGVVLGIFEITVFVALAVWMMISNAGDLTLKVLDPTHAAAGTYNGVFKGMVFAILAFIGFEAAAPLGEEARSPRWTVPRAVVLSAFGIGIFYVVCSYAWVIGTGFDNFTKDTLAQADPWRHLGKVFWGGGWVLVWLAILNSAIANSNAGVNASTRVIYSLGRNGALPRAFARTHPTHKTPHVAIIAQTILGLLVALLLGWKYSSNLITAFSIIATAVTIVVIVVYITVCFSCIVYYSRVERLSMFNPWLHWVFPILGAAAFVPPLYYQYFPLPAYPIRYANWIALGWLAAGVLVTAFVPKRILVDTEHFFAVEEATGEPEEPALAPRTAPLPAEGS
jgi:amino acid transporter